MTHNIILSQHSKRHSEKKESFHVLEVDEDNVQMSKFIEKKLGSRTFENGRAFYEFTDEENLIYYKEIVTEQRNKVSDS